MINNFFQVGNNRLRNLFLSSNHIGNEGAKAFWHLLKGNDLKVMTTLRKTQSRWVPMMNGSSSSSSSVGRGGGGGRRRGGKGSGKGSGKRSTKSGSDSLTVGETGEEEGDDRCPSSPSMASANTSPLAELSMELETMGYPQGPKKYGTKMFSPLFLLNIF